MLIEKPQGFLPSCRGGLLVSFFLRSIRCRSAQSSHLVWPGIEGEVQPTQSPEAFALSRLSCAWRRWYSLRSGRWARFRSYSRRSCFGASGSSGLGVVGFLVALFGLAGRGFFPVLFVAFGPRRVFLGSAKVCSSVILLEYCAGSGSGIGYDEGGDSGRFCLGGLPQFPASSGKYEGSIPARSGSVALQDGKRQCLSPQRGVFRASAWRSAVRGGSSSGWVKWSCIGLAAQGMRPAAFGRSLPATAPPTRDVHPGSGPGMES